MAPKEVAKQPQPSHLSIKRLDHGHVFRALVLECSIQPPSSFPCPGGRWSGTTALTDTSITLKDEVESQSSPDLHKISVHVTGQDPVKGPCVMFAFGGRITPHSGLDAWYDICRNTGVQLRMHHLNSMELKAGQASWWEATLTIVCFGQADCVSAPGSESCFLAQELFEAPPDVRLACSDGATLYTHVSILSASSEVWKITFNGDWAEGANGASPAKVARTEAKQDVKELARCRCASVDASRIVAAASGRVLVPGTHAPPTSSADIQELYNLAKSYLAAPLQQRCADMLVGIWTSGGPQGLIEALFADFTRLHPELADALIPKLVSCRRKVKAAPEWDAQMAQIVDGAEAGSDEAHRAWAGLVLAKLSRAGFNSP